MDARYAELLYGFLQYKRECFEEYAVNAGDAANDAEAEEVWRSVVNDLQEQAS